jgi:hypothetical protein
VCARACLCLWGECVCCLLVLDSVTSTTVIHNVRFMCGIVESVGCLSFWRLEIL